MIEPPAVAFSEWVRWRDRSRLSKAASEPSMGVYLWGRFTHKPPEMPPFPELPKDLIYVGETNDLDARLLGVDGARHHRLKHYAQMFPKDNNYARLYVSVFRVGPFQRRDKHCHALRAYTRYVESLVYWEYTRRYDQRPRLDYKVGKEPWLFPH